MTDKGIEFEPALTEAERAEAMAAIKEQREERNRRAERQTAAADARKTDKGSRP